METYTVDLQKGKNKSRRHDIEENAHVKLVCKFKGTQTPKWAFNGVAIPSGNEGISHSSESNEVSLNIPSFKSSEHEGTYTCYTSRSIRTEIRLQSPTSIPVPGTGQRYCTAAEDTLGCGEGVCMVNEGETTGFCKCKQGYKGDICRTPIRFRALLGRQKETKKVIFAVVKRHVTSGSSKRVMSRNEPIIYKLIIHKKTLEILDDAIQKYKATYYEYLKSIDQNQIQNQNDGNTENTTVYAVGVVAFSALILAIVAILLIITYRRKKGKATTYVAGQPNAASSWGCPGFEADKGAYFPVNLSTNDLLHSISNLYSNDVKSCNNATSPITVVIPSPKDFAPSIQMLNEQSLVQPQYISASNRLPRTRKLAVSESITSDTSSATSKDELVLSPKF